MNAQIEYEELPEATPPVVASNEAKPRTVCGSLATSALVGLVLWTGLIALWAVCGAFQLAWSGILSDLSSRSQAKAMGAFLGIVMSAAIMFGAWLAGAVPAFMAWFILKDK